MERLGNLKKKKLQKRVMQNNKRQREERNKKIRIKGNSKKDCKREGK